jgi:8-oxo-dGTP pyrophosphatase MutT (NUDIX family)
LKIIREFSSGGIVFKDDKWLVRSTMPSKQFPKIYWMLPKGWIDDAGPDAPGPMASGKIKADEESLRKNALREVQEEAGVDAKIIEKIGTGKYFFEHPGRGKILKFVTFYLMEWTRDLLEGFDGETSEVLWLPFEEAYKKLSFGGEKQMLKKAKNLLASVV